MQTEDKFYVLVCLYHREINKSEQLTKSSTIYFKKKIDNNIALYLYIILNTEILIIQYYLQAWVYLVVHSRGSIPLVCTFKQLGNYYHNHSLKLYNVRIITQLGIHGQIQYVAQQSSISEMAIFAMDPSFCHIMNKVSCFVHIIGIICHIVFYNTGEFRSQ